MTSRPARLCRLVLCAAALLAPPGAATPPEPPPAPSPAEVEELRRLLEELRRRVAALEAAATAPRPDVEEVAKLLAEAERRITALEQAPAPPPAETPLEERPTKSRLDLSPPKKPQPEDWRRYLPDFYGSLRVRIGATDGGDVEISDLLSRVGLMGEAPIAGRVAAVGRLELGVNVVNQNPKYVIGPGGEVTAGKGANPVTSRLGFVGVKTPAGSFTYGKQWSVYYWIAGVTDGFWTFGGEAAGAYPVGDGGIAGTGRPEQATNWRLEAGPVHLGLQAQHRSRTVNDQEWADTWGAAAGVDVTKELRLGAAWNEVRDGVPDPGLNEPMEGDRAAVFAAQWQKGPLLAALTFSPSWNHSIDEKGRYLDTLGWELFVQYDVGRRWQLLGGFNALSPSDPEASRFRILDGIFGVVYRFGKEMLVTGELRLDESRASDGERLRAGAVFALGLNYGW